MQTLLDEMLNHDCKHSYFMLEQEIVQLKDVVPSDEPPKPIRPYAIPGSLKDRILKSELFMQEEASQLEERSPAT